MFSVITKRDYWSALRDGVVPLRTARLKDIQDAFILHQLKDIKGARILELGGGQSRILPILAKENECWNIDKFEGLGAGPLNALSGAGIRLIKDYIGNYSPEVPSDYFDYVVSVSALEHVPTPFFADMLKDSKRILKVGGKMIHAIDVYLLANVGEHAFGSNQSARIELYKSSPELSDGGLAWLSPPEIDGSLTADLHFASNQMDELYLWNKIAPALEDVREISMSCSLKFGARKTA